MVAIMFYALPVGAKFSWANKVYTKTATDYATRGGFRAYLQGSARVTPIAPPAMALKKVSAGVYQYRSFTVERHPSGWRWLDTNNIGVGGEWRSTLREASLDLKEYLGC